jgi:hypothetical protein
VCFANLVCLMLQGQESLAMSADGPVLSRIKDGSTPSNISVRQSLFSVRSMTRVARIVALCVCFLTIAQLASALPGAALPSSPQAKLYRFNHFPFEEVGTKAWLASSPGELQCDRIRATGSPRPLPARARMVLGAFVRARPTTPIRFRIPPPSSDDDHH